ncbi:MAG TPA: nuclear transport factor 2 family protein [Solirubrobacteraceae bacterium]|nr:nuclear transport factor 2 family protein [Solirubrobacteraceae bacterium]
MGEPGEDFRQFLLRQTEAEAAFVQGDPEPRMALWSRRDPVSLLGAFGMYESGWDRLSQTFIKVAATFSSVSEFRYEIEVADVLGDMAYTVGYERFKGSISGRPMQDVTVRVTHAYRREDGEWKIVHRHGDSASLSPEFDD